MKTDHFAAYSEYIGLWVTASRLIRASHSGDRTFIQRLLSYRQQRLCRSRLWNQVVLHAIRRSGAKTLQCCISPPTAKPRSGLHEIRRTAVGGLWPSRECWGEGGADVAFSAASTKESDRTGDTPDLSNPGSNCSLGRTRRCVSDVYLWQIGGHAMRWILRKRLNSLAGSVLDDHFQPNTSLPQTTRLLVGCCLVTKDESPCL